MGFFGSKEPAYDALAGLAYLSWVLGYEYFGDLASGEIFTETNWRPSVTTRGRGTSGYSDLNGGFRARKKSRKRKWRICLIFRVLAHEYFGDLASGKIFTETNWRPSVTTRGRGTSGYSDLNGGFRARKSRRNRN